MTGVETTPIGAFTVKLVDPETPAENAVIVTEPAVDVVANPELLMVATAVFDELQLTEGVKFSEVLSLKTPVAVNCCVPPAVTAPFAGVTWIDINVPSTSIEVLPDIDPELAVMMELPWPTAVVSPVELTAIAPVFEEDQVAEPVRSWVLLSL